MVQSWGRGGLTVLLLLLLVASFTTTFIGCAALLEKMLLPDEKLGRICIEAMSYSSGYLHIYVRNLGVDDLTLDVVEFKDVSSKEVLLSANVSVVVKGSSIAEVMLPVKVASGCYLVEVRNEAGTVAASQIFYFEG